MNGSGDHTLGKESQPRRRSLLRFGGGLAVAPLLSRVTGTSPGGQAVAAEAGAPRPFRWPTLSREALTYSVPAADWQSQALPIGNGRLGAMPEGVDKTYDGQPSTKWCIERPGPKVQWQVELPTPTAIASCRTALKSSVAHETVQRSVQ
ncbi:glycoside hydrolase N-terminal domain-containing protein [Streptomyces sp. NEAU-H22]|uniref:glycoside hydrolase N-terminal domain-containing protein n=1 Tax=Streptomyces sp. NEAU-H22 TaxID=2994655 RepID=UPI00225169D4|nr:glycoside hydrolase N-terminal domain-containing protein [Streptomyces sp. NEAU-H22]MCX3292307.1 glycoside hydrolase N-terminal domain-containing protein [Streptomyces sp. NEAU-H22]